LKRSRKQFLTARKRGFVETGLSVEAPRGARDDAWRQQFEHPPNVSPRHKMQRASHRPGANNRPVGERALDIRLDRVPHTQPDCPERAEIILSLDGAQPGYDGAWLLERGPGNVLVMESETRDV